MSKVKKLKEMKIDGAKVEHQVLAMMAAEVEMPKNTAANTWKPDLRYLVKREATFWKKGYKVLQYFNGAEWIDVPKVRTV